jgi:hypothetical protein
MRSTDPITTYAQSTTGRAAPQPAAAAALQATILSDFLNSAALVAATASIANGIAAGRPGCAAHLLANTLPPIPALFAQSYLELCLSTGSQPFASDLANFYSRLRVYRDLVASAVAVSERSGGLLQLDMAALARDWRGLAQEAAVLIERSETFLDQVDATLAARGPTVSRLLADAQAGASPCLSEHGEIELPAWTDRRVRKRTPKNLQAIFLIGGSFQSAVVVDASERGLGVVGLREVVVGEAIVLLVKPGVSVSGLIAWVNGTRAGISLHEPLPAGSRFLAHLH